MNKSDSEPVKGMSIDEAFMEQAKGRSIDEAFMEQAIAQAKKAYKQNETPIGCVIVHEGKVIARGFNKRNKTGCVLGHAEIEAVRKACKALGDWRLEACTMYVTLEPCPMCAGALIQSRISRVVAGAMNPKAGFAGSLINVFETNGLNHKVEFEHGVLEEKCRQLMTDFFSELRQSKKNV